MDTFLETLEASLRARGVPGAAAAFVRQDVEKRLEEARRLWGVPALRRLYLLPGREEAAFLEARDASPEARALAVVAVRGSALEDLLAERPWATELAGAGGTLTPAGADELTSMAARALERFDEHVAGGGSLELLRTRWPRAHRVLETLANASAAGSAVEPVGGALPATTELDWEATLSSGVDPRLDATLAGALRAIDEGAVRLFFCDSFSQLTRNTGKLWRVIDRVLGAGAAFVTHNYYLATDYAARRERLLAPERDGRASIAKFRETSGLTARHRKALAEVRRGLRSP